MSKLGGRLRELRDSLSLYDVQKGTGISRTQIVLYEKGEQFPSEQSLRKLAHFFDVPYEELRTEYYEDLYSDPAEREILMNWAIRKALAPDENRLLENYRKLTLDQQISHQQGLEEQVQKNGNNHPPQP